MHHDVLQQLCHERCQRFQREAEARRLVLQARGRRQRFRRRLALRATRQSHA